jgi:hypothetical protein
MSEEKDWKSRITTDRYAPGRRERLIIDKAERPPETTPVVPATEPPASPPRSSRWPDRIAVAGLMLTLAITGLAAISAAGNAGAAYRTAKQLFAAIDGVLDPQSGEAAQPVLPSRPDAEKAAAAAKPKTAAPPSFDGVTFIEVADEGSVQRLLAANSSRRRPYDCLNRNEFVIGADGADGKAPLLVIPSFDGKGSEQARTAVCGFRLVIVAVPHDLPGGEKQLKALKQKWARGTSVTARQIDAWSRTMSPSGEEMNRCEVGRRCYILTKEKWPPETFSEFNRYQTASQ